MKIYIIYTNKRIVSHIVVISIIINSQSNIRKVEVMHHHITWDLPEHHYHKIKMNHANYKPPHSRVYIYIYIMKHVKI